MLVDAMRKRAENGLIVRAKLIEDTSSMIVREIVSACEGLADDGKFSYSFIYEREGNLDIETNNLVFQSIDDYFIQEGFTTSVEDVYEAYGFLVHSKSKLNIQW
jgi:hypothetical protein